jgi:hypothetical protein
MAGTTSVLGNLYTIRIAERTPQPVTQDSQLNSSGKDVRVNSNTVNEGVQNVGDNVGAVVTGGDEQCWAGQA